MTILNTIVDKADKDIWHIFSLLSMGSFTGSSGVRINETTGVIDYEYPQLVSMTQEAFDAQDMLTVVTLRTFDHENKVAAPWNPQIMVPTKVVRMWTFKNQQVTPLSESETFGAHTKNSLTGGLVPPEETVSYADAWDVVLAN